MSKKLALFLTAMLQVTFVSMSTVFISRGNVLGMMAAGFMISFIWTINVKKIAFGDWKDRILYASGAMVGTVLGYFLGSLINSVW